MAQKSGEIWTGPRLLQPVRLKSDRLLGSLLHTRRPKKTTSLALCCCSMTTPALRRNQALVYKCVVAPE